MTWLWTILLAGIALSWLVQGSLALWGMSHLPDLTRTPPLNSAECPGISVLFAARDEADALPSSLPTFLAQDYPVYEVIGVDDRSEDATGEILEEFARRNGNMTAVRVRDLPQGWLGKPHSLAAAYEHSTGDWLVFTDADVRFAPSLLRRAMALAQKLGVDHLTLLAAIDMRRVWEKVAIGYLSLAFVLGERPWRATNARAKSYIGIGAFQLVRRAAYQAAGTHARLAMEIVDDMKLGKLIKQAGFRSAVAASGDLVQVRWQAGLANVVRGLTKNMFAALNFSVARVLAGVLGVVAISILPFIALPFTRGVDAVLAGLSVICALLLQAGLLRGAGISPAYAVTQPLGAGVFCYILLRSMVLTLWRGGVVWRGTFYPLDALRRSRL